MILMLGGCWCSKLNLLPLLDCRNNKCKLLNMHVLNTNSSRISNALRDGLFASHKVALLLLREPGSAGIFQELLLLS